MAHPNVGVDGEVLAVPWGSLAPPTGPEGLDFGLLFRFSVEKLFLLLFCFPR